MDTSMFFSYWAYKCHLRKCKQPWRPKKGLDSSKSHPSEERICYHTHSSPNESIYRVVGCTIYRFIWSRLCVITQSFLIWFLRIHCCVSGAMWTKYIDSSGEKGSFYTIFPHILRITQYIDSFGRNGDFFFKLQNIHFSRPFLDLYIGLFVELFNQTVYFSMKIKNMQKKPFEKLVRII